MFGDDPRLLTDQRNELRNLKSSVSSRMLGETYFGNLHDSAVQRQTAVRLSGVVAVWTLGEGVDLVQLRAFVS